METQKETPMVALPRMLGVEETEKYNYKVSDEELWTIWKENDENYTDTAEAIMQKTGMHYSKQAVEQRVKRLKKAETKEKEELIKKAKQRVRDAVFQNQDGKLSLRASLNVLNNLKKYT